MCAVPHQAPSSPTASTSRMRTAGSARSRSSRERLCQRTPRRLSISATESNRSGCRGTRMSRSRGWDESSCWYASRASDSSGSCVLPARNTTSSAAMPASLASRSVSALPRSVRAPSNLIDPVDSTTSGGAPRSKNRWAYSSFWTAIRSISASTRRTEPADAPVAAKALLAEASVDDRHFRAVLAGGANQVGPELQFGQHQQVGTNRAASRGARPRSSRAGNRRRSAERSASAQAESRSAWSSR